MSSERPGLSSRDALTLAILLTALAAVLATRLPGALSETHALIGDLERNGPQAHNCATALAGTGEVAAVLAALDALAGGTGRPPHC